VADAPELVLREQLALLLHEWDLAKYTGRSAPLVEQNATIDGSWPTTIQEFTAIASPATAPVPGSRATVLYRAQFHTRRAGSLIAVENWANDLRVHLDQKEYLPNILGIGLAWETSRAYFPAETARHSAVSVTYAFRGRRAA